MRGIREIEGARSLGLGEERRWMSVMRMKERSKVFIILHINNILFLFLLSPSLLPHHRS